MLSSCLITSTPDFPPPEQTPPFLITESASPNLNAIHLIRSDEEKFEMSAEVRSEDAPDIDDASKGLVYYKILIDYGRPNGTQPYLRAFGGGTALKPASFDDTGRVVTAKWLRRNDPIVGCHTFTLIASHLFRSGELEGCPADIADSSSLTWRVFVCEPGSDCPPPTGANCPADDGPPEVCVCPDDPNAIEACSESP